MAAQNAITDIRSLKVSIRNHLLYQRFLIQDFYDEQRSQSSGKGLTAFLCISSITEIIDFLSHLTENGSTEALLYRTYIHESTINMERIRFVGMIDETRRYM